MNNFYIEEIAYYMGRADKGILISADNVIAAKKIASKLKRNKKAILSLYQVTDKTKKNCKRIAVLSGGYWRNINSNVTHKGIWEETKIALEV